MTMIQRLFSIPALLALLTLGACGGGGGNAGTSSFPGPPGGGGASTVTALDVRLSASTIPNSGSAVVTATVTALDANRSAVSGAAVTLAADSGLLTVLGGSGPVTDTSGQVVATLGLGANLSIRTITISADSGGVKGSAKLQVVDSPAGAVPTSIELIAAATTIGTGGDGVLLRAFVKDANNNALPAAAVSFRASSGTLSAVSTATDAAGTASATISAGANRSNRAATISVTSGAVTSQLVLPVTGTKLNLSGPSSLILGSTATFDIVISDSNSNIVPGVVVTGTSSLGNALTATTPNSTSNSSGQVRFTYLANNPGVDGLVFAGAGSSVSPLPALVVSGEDFTFVSPAAATIVAVNVSQALQVRLRSGGVVQAGKTINFAATGGTLTATTAVTGADGIANVSISSASAGPITVQANVAGSATSTTLPLVVVATVPSKLILQISPTAIAPNATLAGGNQTQVVAKVTDVAGNPVQGQTVNFARVSDPSGGNLLQASSVTDANGQASVAYRSGAQSTANNGVVLSGTVASAPAVTGTAALTVNQTSLFIALGTGNVITNLDPQTYKKDWVVYVTDSNGIPVNGATLTIKAIPTFYRTGKLVFVDPVWVYATPIWECRNEDANANGVLDAGEDDNNDGRLWPGNVIAVTPGTVQTVDGRATISLIYAESYAPWVKLKLTASATVSGTESRTDVEFVVTGLGSDFSSATVPPAGQVSPFGLLPLAGRAAASCIQIQ